MAPHANIDDVINFRIPCPDEDEQRALANFLNDKTGQIDELVLKGEEAILLLGERRAALISAAATGKINVRETDQAGMEAA